MKTKEELNKLKEELETLSKKLCELSDEELEQVVGGRIGLFGTTKGTGTQDFNFNEKTKKYEFEIYESTLIDFLKKSRQ